MKKIPTIWIWVIKILVIVCSYGYIYYQLFYQDNHIHEFQNNFHDFNFLKTGIILLVLVLMTINWSLESIKWRLLVKPLEKISFITAFQGILIGLTTSIFTPNRTGEYFGRIWVLSSKRVQGILATIIGSVAQIMITLIAGIVALLILSNKTSINISEIENNRQLILYTAIGLVLIILCTLFLFPKLTSRFKRFRRLYLFISFLSQYSFSHILKVLILSLLRYTIFILQFYLLIRIFNISLAFTDIFLALSLVYFIMAFIPSFTIAEIGIRGSIAITIFNIFTPETTGVFLAISLLWIINIAIPAIVGSYSLLKLKIRLNVSK